jgi:4-amino-4-deoxy-L-arabinose transferase-like glycosyltransferase
VVLAWLVAAGVIVGTAFLAAASLRLPAFTGFLLAAYVVAVGEIVLLTEVLSLVDGVGAAEYAIGEAVLLVVAAVVWLRRGRPLPSLPALSRHSLSEHPVLVFLAVVVVLAFGYQAFLTLATPPNNWDSLVYHLARAAEWSQRGAVEYYPSHSESVNAAQPNASMLALHGFTFAGRDTFAALSQLLAELACVVAVYGIAVRLGVSRAASAFAALLVATLPLVALQSVTTQNDLLTASFLAAALYFTLGKARAELALAGLAVGLALGTKATAVFALPLLLLAATLVHDRREVLFGIAATCAGFALVGAYGYVLNLAHTGRPLGGQFATLLGPEPTFSGTASTAARLGYNFLDLSGYPVPSSATRPIERAGEELFGVAHIPVNPPDSTMLEPRRLASPFAFTINDSAEETRSYFGPLAALVLLPLSLASLVAVARRRAPPAFLVPALATPLFILGVAYTTRYHEFGGRYLMPGVVLAMPLAALVYRRRRVAVAVAGIGVLTLALVHVANETKPSGAIWKPAIWSMTRAQAQSVTREAMTPVIESVERHVPSDGRLGHALRYNDWIYPFYGPRLERQLVSLPRRGFLREADRVGVDAVIVSGLLKAPPPAWRALVFPGAGWTLLLRETS